MRSALPFRKSIFLPSPPRLFCLALLYNVIYDKRLSHFTFFFKVFLKLYLRCFLVKYSVNRLIARLLTSVESNFRLLMFLFALVADYGLFPDFKFILFVNRRFSKIFLLLYHITDKFSTQRRKKID